MTQVSGIKGKQIRKNENENKNKNKRKANQARDIDQTHAELNCYRKLLGFIHLAFLPHIIGKNL